MSSVCSAEEIAEKRRIAQERLKQKLTAKKTNATAPPVNNPKQVIVNNNIVLTSKSAPKFYDSSANFKKPSAPPSVSNNQNSYKKFISTFSKQSLLSKQTDPKSDDTPSPKNFKIFSARITCELSIISESKFHAKPSKYHEQLINVFKTIPSKQYDAATRLWNFSIADYEVLQKNAEGIKSEVELIQIPKQVLDLLRNPTPAIDYSYLTAIEPKLVKILLPFQKEGVCFGIAKQGRIMIADEMGLGKTLQALAIADFFRKDWPLLITTTASTRSSWFNHVKEYLPSVRCNDIVTLNSAEFSIYDAKVVITSYSLMEKHVEKLLDRNFGTLIFDESHNLKSFDAKRTKNAEKLSKMAKRIILLSGTPALSKPVELYSQIKMIDDKYLPFKAFSQRYCDGKQTNFGWDSSGQSNLTELNAVLKKKFMIRRLKSEVLSQLAEKNREMITLNPDLIKLSEEVKKNFNEFEFQLSKGSNQSKDILLTFYAKTAEIKARAVCDYLKRLVKEKKKFIVFAHHKTMMNAISEFLSANKIDFIRIDGTTKGELREEYVKRFQTRSSCKVALLSLHACNAGITLTAADLVIFAELDWNPSTLAQAESRAHRIGQMNTVTCRYLLAENTADTVIWKMLKEKQEVLNNAGLFSENLQNANHCLAPTSNEKIDKYFSPGKRKVENFYGTPVKNSVSSSEEDNRAKKIKIDSLEKQTENLSKDNANEVKDANVCVYSSEIYSVQTNSEDYEDLFSGLEDTEIPSTVAALKNANKPVQNELDELFGDMEDSDFVNLDF